MMVERYDNDEMNVSPKVDCSGLKNGEMTVVLVHFHHMTEMDGFGVIWRIAMEVVWVKVLGCDEVLTVVEIDCNRDFEMTVDIWVWF